MYLLPKIHIALILEQAHCQEQPFERHCSGKIYKIIQTQNDTFWLVSSWFYLFFVFWHFFCIISFSGIYRSLPSLCSQENHQSHLSKSILFLQKIFFFWHLFLAFFLNFWLKNNPKHSTFDKIRQDLLLPSSITLHGRGGHFKKGTISIIMRMTVEKTKRLLNSSSSSSKDCRR